MWVAGQERSKVGEHGGIGSAEDVFVIVSGEDIIVPQEG